MTEASPQQLDQIRAVIRQSRGAEVSLQRIGGYLARSEVFAVNGDEGVLKVYHHAAEKKWRREISAYHLLASRGIAEVPRLLMRGRLGCGLPWALVEYRRGEIREFGRGLASSEQNAVYAAIGSLLARLHRVDVSDYELNEVSRADARAASIRILDRQTQYNEAVLAQSLPARKLFREADRLMMEIRDELLRHGGSEIGFVHGDFSLRNILIDAGPSGWCITGLIDFEKSRVSDPMEDFAMLFFKNLVGNPAAGQAFLQGYRRNQSLQPTPEICRRFIYYLCGLVFEIATWAYKQDRPYYEYSIQTLQRAMQGETLFAHESETSR